MGTDGTESSPTGPKLPNWTQCEWWNMVVVKAPISQTWKDKQAKVKGQPWRKQILIYAELYY